MLKIKKMIKIILTHLHQLSLSKWLILLGFLLLATSKWTGINEVIAWIMVIGGFALYFRLGR